MDKLLAYAAIAWFFASIIFAADRSVPIVEAFKPVRSFKAFVWQLILLVWVGMLAMLQYHGCPAILGQQPYVWSLVLLTAYAWACLIHHAQSTR